MSRQGVQDGAALGNDSPNTRFEFFELYKQEAEAHDTLFLTKHSDDLSNTMIFAGLLSAVSGAFIISVQANLQPDYGATTAALLKVLIHTINNSTFANPDLTPLEWTGPDNTVVAAEILLCLSLAASLLAAFFAMLGKQWTNQYSKGKRGTLIEYCRDRQRKLDGIKDWRFDLIMESLPLMLQLALFLLWIALSQCMWGINKVVSSVIISATSISILLYDAIVVSATFSDSCPFQTPASHLLRYLINYDYSSLNSGARRHLKSALDFDFSYVIKAKRRPIKSSPTDIEPLFDVGGVELEGNRLDAHCVMWMRETSTDPKVNTVVMRFISEVEWNAHVDVTPSLVELATELRKYCDSMSSFPSTIQSTKDKAHETAKAFLHLYVQRRCVNEREIPVITDTGVLGRHEGVWDNDLEFTLWMIDHIVGGYRPMVWPGFNDDTNISISHMSWISHVLLHHIYIQVSCKRLTTDIQDDLEGLVIILQKFWSIRGCISFATITDCILICGLTLGLQIHREDLSAVDKGQQIHKIVDKLYDRVKATFEKSYPPTQVEQALRLLRFLTLWHDRENVGPAEAVVTLHLCQSILNSTVCEDLKWDAARLVMQIGFRYRESDACVLQSSTVCVRFLEHHLALEPLNNDSIADALHALTIIHHEGHLKLEMDYLRRDAVVRLICSVLKDPRQVRLTRVALRFVLRIATILGDPKNAITQEIFIDHDFSTALRKARESIFSINDRQVLDTYLSIFESLSLSPIWHRYLLQDHLEIFQYAVTRDLYWLDPLLTGDCARKMLGWKCLAEFVRIAWKAGLHSVDFPRLVRTTGNLLVMKGKPAIQQLTTAVNEALRAAEAKKKTGNVFVLNELVQFFKDVEKNDPNGWEDIVASKAKDRRRKSITRMRLRWKELHSLNGDNPALGLAVTK